MDDKAKTASNMEREQQEENPNNQNELVAEAEDTGSNLDPQQQQQPSSRTRTPFTNLSQVDADLALARTLQEQERAYWMINMNTDGSDYGSWEAGSFLHDEDDDFGGHDDDDTDADQNENEEEEEEEDDDDDDDDDEDAFDVHAHDHDEDVDENNPSVEYDSDVFSSDEAYARALQDAEEREMTARFISVAGINDREIPDPGDHIHGVNSQCLMGRTGR